MRRVGAGDRQAIALDLAHDTPLALVDGATPLDMTGFTAWRSDIVPASAVFTHTDGCNRGAARRAVALHPAGVRVCEVPGLARTGTSALVPFPRAEGARG
ncbi:hypothetical protein N8I71_00855 [Roseibacterium sp. SDUM158016]|uniref:hypothetical protein n=1 Tax=Roseicyclus sediminis TaxID=2980997 RepID=UPI0021CFCC03|nr:hypothetical protein [Roseibacterium sp. SDUM158016]MCU4651365.1 hypothetical protein [Roseibacterium sp. SDUM158016]